MINYLKKRVAIFATLLLFFISPSTLFSKIIDINDDVIAKTAAQKIEEMGNELYSKTGVSIRLIAKKHLTQKEFLAIKNDYLSKLKPPYILWIFSHTYMDRKNIGINQMFKSSDLNDKFDEDALFSPWRGSFTRLITTKSKGDIVSAAFLNGFADMADRIADAYGVKLDSSVGNTNKNIYTFLQVIFYGSIIFFVGGYFYRKYFYKSNS